ncbi:serine/arginine repetitive matrix protein 2-like isoform X3 [Pecten maximus]|uniref:serine/arginine repetitive matrix protein 2-like isoform X3 n=1 Tax=Pecten maximus TaxID=6579 RepID=UPI00145821E3|nr:serine/arginine repetitive matrix protein 2-like isoform X3 [Pecten maximus]
MALKRKLEDECGDFIAGSEDQEQQDRETAAATEADALAKKNQGSHKKTYIPTGKPRGRPRTIALESGASSEGPRKQGRPSLASKSGTENTVDTTLSDSPKKRGRPSLASKSETVGRTLSASPKKRGRPSLASKSGTENTVDTTLSDSPKKRGRPSLASKSETVGRTLSASPEKRGRPSLASKSGTENTVDTTLSDSPKKRGRPSLASKSETVGRTLSASPKKRGRPSLASKSGTENAVDTTLSDSPKKRGRPSLASKSGSDTNGVQTPEQPRKRGRPVESSKKGGAIKAATGKPRDRGRPSKSARKTPYVPTGKPRGRRPLGENGARLTPYVPTGKPRGRPPLGENGIKVKRKYSKNGMYHQQATQFKIRRSKFKEKTHEKKLNVKPLKAEPPKQKNVSKSCQDRRSSTSNVNSPVYNVTPRRRNNAIFPMLNEFQRSLLHVNHSKTLMNYESDCEPALDVLQKKLLAVNTQLIDTEEQRLELDKRIIIIKQRKIELERQLLNYQPKRRVLTRVEQAPVVDMVNNQESGIEHGAKIRGWVAVPQSVMKSRASCTTSRENCESNDNDQVS